MKRTTERKWHSLLNGVALTICPSMWGRQRRLSWDFRRRNSVDHPPLTINSSTVESAELNSWGCTLQRISPGPPTPCHSPRRHNSAYTFSAVWKEQVSLHPSSPHSTGAPLRASEPAPPDCSTAFSPRLWEPWTQITPPSSETPCKPLPPETWTPPSEHPPTLPHQRKKNCMKLFFVQFKVCYTQVSGPVQTTCSNTLSSMHTRHFSHTAVCTQSHKRLSNICMFTCSCTTNHLALFPSQLLDSQCFSLHMYSIYV